MPEKPDSPQDPQPESGEFFDRFGNPEEFLSAIERNPEASDAQSSDAHKMSEEELRFLRVEMERMSSEDYDAAIEMKTGKRMHKRLSREYLDIVGNIRFRLAGFPGLEDRKISETQDAVEARLAKDLNTVRTIERSLVLDPLDARRELRELPKALERVDHDYHRLDPKKFPFARQGRHLNVTSAKKLRSVWEDGYVILAEMRTGEHEYFPVGYLYGLMNGPASQKGEELDPNFPNLDLRDVGIPDDLRASAIRDRNKMIAIWRTSVRQSVSKAMVHSARMHWPFEQYELELRRAGIGTALKNVVMRMAAIHGKVRATLNVGELRLRNDETVHMPNQASMSYNQEFLHPWAWRQQYHNKIMLDKRKNNHVASMYWLAHHNSIRSAIQEMERPGSVLQGKGWMGENAPHSNLGRDSVAIADDLYEAERLGIHKKLSM